MPAAELGVPGGSAPIVADIAGASPTALAIAAVVGYAIGSINPAATIARLRGVDLRGTGSGNPGATNAARAMGAGWGIAIGLLDVAKGLVPALIFAGQGLGAAEAAGMAAVVGHITSPFLRGHGGKGVATTLGALLGAQPLWVPWVLVGFVAGFLATRRVGIGAASGSIVLIVLGAVAPTGDGRFFGVAMGLLVLVRHMGNIADLWRSRTGGTPPGPSTPPPSTPPPSTPPPSTG